MIEENQSAFIFAISMTVLGFFVVVTTIAVLAVVSRKKISRSEAQLKELAAQLSAKEELVRKEIAEDLHHLLGRVSMISTQYVSALLKKASPEIRNGLQEIAQKLDQFGDEARVMIHELSPRELYNFGLPAAIRALVSAFEQEEGHLTVHTEDYLGDDSPEQEIGLFLYRSAREFMQNALRHGRATQILLTLRRDNEFAEIIVEDNGVGFPPGSARLARKKGGGFGLLNFSNRAEVYGGGLSVARSVRRGGGRVSVRAPMKSGGVARARS